MNTYVSRTIYDLPVSGRCCRIHIELAQVRTTEGERRIEACDFVEKGVRYSKRFCEQINGLCRHMPISVIARHYGLLWETIKNIDKASLHRTLPPSEPAKLRGLKRIGVDEVAKAKGHYYMTVVVDMDNGQLIWVEHGRTHRVLESFITQLTKQTAQGIQAVAMGMGKAYRLDAWCQLAKGTRIMSVLGFASMLQDYKEGICNFAKYDRLTSAIIEAGNVSIGLLRRIARGSRDTDYFKLKIKKLSVPDVKSMFSPSVKLT